MYNATLWLKTTHNTNNTCYECTTFE